MLPLHEISCSLQGEIGFIAAGHEGRYSGNELDDLSLLKDLLKKAVMIGSLDEFQEMLTVKE